MSRLTSLRHDDLDDDQRLVWDSVTGGRRAAAHGGTGGLVTEDGGLIGPFNAWLHGPALGLAAVRLGEAVRFASALDRRTLELAICVVAVHWRADFEMWAHGRYAVEAGVDPDLLASLGEGGPLRATREHDELLVGACRQMLTTGRLDTATYDALIGVLGTTGVVDLVTVVGYYSTVSFNLNVFEVPAPPGFTAPWPA